MTTEVSTTALYQRLWRANTPVADATRLAVERELLAKHVMLGETRDGQIVRRHCVDSDGLGA